MREKMIEYMLKHGWGSGRPTKVEVDCMRKYYEQMTDEQLFDEEREDLGF